MIRPMKETEKDDLLEFLYMEPEINLYMIKEVEHFDPANKHQDIYVETDSEGYKAVLSRNWSNAIYYARELAFNDAWVDILKQLDFLFISSKTALIKLIHPHFPSMKEDRMDFMRSTAFTPD
ncbi:MAG: hypothetical protein ACQEQA_03985, partial [Bacillota bacterium]